MRRRLFLDTPVFVVAYGEGGSPEDSLLEAAILGEYTVVLSDRIIDESLRVVRNLFGQAAASKLRATMFELPSLRFVAMPEWERAIPLVAPFARDLSDAPHFAAARAGRADTLVTINRRSVLPGMFDLVPIATPEFIVEAIVSGAKWPTPHEMRVDWERWARSSRRAPRGERPKG